MLNPNELVLTFGSFTSVPIFVHIIVILRRLDQCKSIYWKFVKCVLEISWKSPGNLLGWICRHPVIVNCVVFVDYVVGIPKGNLTGMVIIELLYIFLHDVVYILPFTAGTPI